MLRILVRGMQRRGMSYGSSSWLSNRLSKKLSQFGAFDQIKKAAIEKEDDKAMVLLGMCYAMGRDVDKCDVTAAEWFRKSAQKGNAESQLAMGLWVLEGRGNLQADPLQAKPYLESASAAGLGDASAVLGILWLEGKLGRKDEAAAAELFRKASDKGNWLATYNLGVLIAEGRGTSTNPSKGYELIRKAAVAGLADAQYALAAAYNFGGMKLKRDAKKAHEWMLKAAKQGKASAQYSNGEGVVKNVSEAIIWYKKAAEQGMVEGMCNLGTLLLSVEEVKNPAEGFKWTLKAALKGYELAKFNAGYCYHTGLGTEKNTEEAMRWYKEAAEKGHKLAMQQLAVMYRKGEGVAADEEAAKEWERKAGKNP